MRSVLKILDYRRLWIAQVVSNFGDALTSMALLLFVNELTGSTAALATMALALAIPRLLFGMVAGVLVDRYNRKRIMLLSEIGRGILVLGFVVAVLEETLPLLYAIAFAKATIETAFMPARNALIPKIVPADILMSANALGQITRMLMSLFGTAAATIIVAAMSNYWLPFVIDGITFFISFYLLLRLAVDGTPQRTTTKPKSTNPVGAMWHELSEGMTVVFRNRLLTGVLISLTMTMFGLGAVNLLIVPFILNVLKMHETLLAAIEFTQVVSMILGGAIFGSVAQRLKPTRVISAGLIVIGIFVAMLGVVVHEWHLFVVFFLMGLALTPLQAAASTIMQLAISDELRGRVGGAAGTVTESANLASMALAGAFGEALGVRTTLILGGGMVILAGLMAAILFAGAPPLPITSETSDNDEAIEPVVTTPQPEVAPVA